MSTTKAKIMGFLMTALLAFSAPLVYADNGNGGNVAGGQAAVADEHSSHHRGGFFKDLTDDQKKQLKDIWEKQKDAKKAAFEQIKADKDAITNELLQTTPDVNKINDLKSKLEALSVQMLDNRISTDLEVKKILTAEQFARYLEFQKHKFGRFHRGHGKHCRHHHGHKGYSNDDND